MCLRLKKAACRDTKRCNGTPSSSRNKTPSDIVDRLYEAISGTLNSPELTAGLTSAGAKKVATTPSQSDAFFRNGLFKWADVAKRGKLAL